MTTTENEQRDELARELFIADNSNQPREASILDWEWFEATGKQRGQLEHYRNMATGMIAAGYRKSHTITTDEELAKAGHGNASAAWEEGARWAAQFHSEYLETEGVVERANPYREMQAKPARGVANQTTEEGA